MKRYVFSISLVIWAYAGFSQKTFGVSPGIGFSGAYFGTLKGKFMPYCGLQYAGVSYTYEESGVNFDYDLNRVVSYDDTEKLSVSLIVPNLGLRYYLKENEQLKTFLNLNIAKPFLIGSREENGEEVEDFKEDTKKLKMFGGELGFGTEYYLSPQFALGGEFGIRFFRARFNDTYEDEYYNPITDEYVQTETTYTYKASVSPTYTRIFLSYYF